MDIIEANGVKVCLIAAPFIQSDGTPKIGKLGFLCSELALIAQRGESAMIATFYGQVVTGTILTKHIFRGLRRSLLRDDDHEADKKILVYSRKPAIDWIWKGDPHTGELVRVDPPTRDSVFAVIVSPNEKHCDEFSLIDGWVNSWTWIHEDKGLPEAPINWVDRYQDKLWTK